MTVTIWKLVRQIEEQSEKENHDYAVSKATILVNYGTNGKTRPGWIKDETMSLLEMIMTIFKNYEKLTHKEKNENQTN